MKKKKKKAPVPAVLISSVEGLEAAFNRYVQTRLTITRAKAKLEERIAELNAEFDRAYGAEQTEVISLETGIELFCRTHRKTLFPEGEKKSIDYANGRVGFRDNPVSVGKIVSKDTFERIAERMDALEWAEPFLNYSVSLNKTELINRRSELTPEQLHAAGIQFDKGETFYIEPASDLLDAARKVEKHEEAA